MELLFEFDFQRDIFKIMSASPFQNNLISRTLSTYFRYFNAEFVI